MFLYNMSKGYRSFVLYVINMPALALSRCSLVAEEQEQEMRFATLGGIPGQSGWVREASFVDSR